MKINKKIIIEDHKHCGCCLAVLREIGRFHWELPLGVIIIYQCDCGIWVDEEYGKIKEIYKYDGTAISPNIK